jgi:hypothetical protein
MTDWEFHAAFEGTLSRLDPDGPVPQRANGLWCRPAGAEEWSMELLLDEREGEDWVFRRCRAIRWPVATLALSDSGGISYLRPEIQLLYKAKAHRPKDDADLVALLPHLDEQARNWLATALGSWKPDHPGIQRVGAVG